MSQIYRLFGVDFSPARLDIRAIPRLEKTGFEIGSEYTFAQNRPLQLREHHIFEALGISPHSEEAMEFEDHVKYGNNVVIDYVRDLLAGREHAVTHRKMVSDATDKLMNCLIYAKQNRLEIEYLDFPAGVLEGFSGGDFLVCGVGGASLSAVDMFANPSALKGGKLLIGPERNIEFALHPDFVYSQDACRAVHNYVGAIVETLYVIIAECMEQQYHEQAVDYVRKQVERRASMCIGEEGPIPNFYLLEK